MASKQIEVPEELIELFGSSHLGDRPTDEQVRLALAAHLFLEGLVSIGKAAELGGQNRIDFEWLLVEMGLPTVRYEVADYEADLRGISQLDRREAS